MSAGTERRWPAPSRRRGSTWSSGPWACDGKETSPRARRPGVLPIVFTGMRRELKRPSAIFPIAAGTVLTTVISILLVFFASLFLQGQPLDLSFFYNTASNPAILFFVTLMAAGVGSGLIADDRSSMALTLYLSRPITQADYL